MDLFAWIGEDETGDYGIKMVLMPVLGATNAVFATRRMAEHPIVLQQMQTLANVLKKPMALKRFTEAEELKVFTPNPQG